MYRTQWMFDPKNDGKNCVPVYRMHLIFELLIKAAAAANVSAITAAAIEN